MIRLLLATLLACASLIPQAVPPRQFLLRVEPVRADFTFQNMDEKERQLAGEHMAYLKGLLESGKLTFAGQAFDPKGFFGIFVVNAPDAESAAAILNGDPMIKANMFRGAVIPFRTVLERGGR